MYRYQKSYISTLKITLLIRNYLIKGLFRTYALTVYKLFQ